MNNCFLCNQWMNESPGQIVYYHGKCRSEARKRYGTMSTYIRALKNQWKPTGQAKVEDNQITLKPTLWQRLLIWLKKYVRLWIP